MGCCPRRWTNTVRATIYRLRRKIEVDPGEPVHLITESGRGYRLEVGRSFQPAPARRTNLRVRAWPMFGRSGLLARIDAYFDADSRLITLVGAPGAGKTRLAEAVGQRHLSTAGTEVWLCDLATSSNLAEVANALRTAVHGGPIRSVTATAALDWVSVRLSRVALPPHHSRQR